MDVPPPAIMQTNVDQIPIHMPSGAGFLERFEPLTGDGLTPPPLPPRYATQETLQWSRPSSSTLSSGSMPSSSLYSLRQNDGSGGVMAFAKKHGLMITNSVLTIIVFGLLMSRVTSSSSEKALPAMVGALLATTALTIFQRYNYSPCTSGPKWVGYLTTLSLFSSMIVLAIWIQKTKPSATTTPSK